MRMSPIPIIEILMSIKVSMSHVEYKKGLMLCCLFFKEQVAPPGVKWKNHIHYTGSCIALTFLFIKPATKRDLLVNPIAAGT